VKLVEQYFNDIATLHNENLREQRKALTEAGKIEKPK
jgi:hypothetical protein